MWFDVYFMGKHVATKLDRDGPTNIVWFGDERKLARVYDGSGRLVYDAATGEVGPGAEEYAAWQPQQS